MVFRSKVDNSFRIVIFIAILIIGAVTFLPLFIDDDIKTIDVIILSSIFIITVGFMLWIAVSIKYIFHKDHLFVKGGPFRSRIPYEEITKIDKTKDIFTGYRILSSTDGIEIFYQSAMLGSVKISPKDSEYFISEIKKRCPNITIQV
jgi:hypothetical protein